MKESAPGEAELDAFLEKVVWGSRPGKKNPIQIGSGNVVVSRATGGLGWLNLSNNHSMVEVGIKSFVELLGGSEEQFKHLHHQIYTLKKRGIKI